MSKTHLKIQTPLTALVVFFSMVLIGLAEEPLDFEKYWSFDDEKTVAGVFGSAGVFPREEQITVDMNFLPVSGKLEKFSISSWIRPEKYDTYNEIFRHECNERILFSLQENATILALGLNINGYVECDAPLDREPLFDGNWHFVAATFDGQMMRVYFDGHEIASLPRAGEITVIPRGTGFVGSSGGHGEFFVGEIDELKITSEGVSPEEIRADYKAGLEKLETLYADTTKRIDRFYTKAYDLPETLVATRAAFLKLVREDSMIPTSEIKTGLMRRLRLDFEREVANYTALTGCSPVDFITDGNLAALEQQTRLQIGRMTEYKPLTSEQWRHLSETERLSWHEIDQLQQKFEQLNFDGSAPAVKTLLTLLEKASAKIEERPRGREAVAPYILPSTPEPKTYSTAAATEHLRRDWLYQCDDNPTPQRVLQEIDWALALGRRIMSDGETSESCDRDFYEAACEKLAAWKKEADSLARSDSESLYFRIRELKREMQLKNPLVDFQQLLLVDMPYPGGSEWQHETRHRLGYMAVPGGQLLVVDGLNLTGNVRRLMPQEPLHGSFWRPDLSFDGKRVLVSFKPHNEKAFHIYEIDLDGKGSRQITAGMFDDLDPVYLPDGKNFVFSTSRSHTYVRCMPPTNAFVLARCALDGDEVYLISQNNEPDYLPSVMYDGRIIYTRWEYTDKPLWRCQSLWTANPDGTQHSAFWGNQSVWPDLLKDARSIPGSRRVMFTGSAHHDWFAGSIGIIDPDGGSNFPYGLTKVTADVVWPETGNGPVDPVESSDYHSSGDFRAYYSPYPLSEKDFLVSANKNGKFLLYLMDVDGNRELIYEGVNNILHAIPIRERETPPALPDRVQWPSRTERADPQPGTIYSGNVYHGAPLELQGKAKFLRILNIEPKTYTLWDQRPYISTGPVVSMVQSEGVKRVLGTVPIQDDGSVWFEAPSGVALHFQLLDENHLALQTMRSFTGLMPGESRGCLGCHEMHSKSPDMSGTANPLALQKPPQKITPVPWAFDEENTPVADRSTLQRKRDFVKRNGTSVSYLKDVQPVLDRYCGECHQGDGEAREVFDMTRRPGFLMFDEPYVTIIGAPNWGAPGQFPTNAWAGGRVHDASEYPPGFNIAGTIHVEAYDQRDPAAYETFPPMTQLSYKSKLIEIASSGQHNDVKVDPDSLLRLILWVDTMCPYIDESDIRAMPDPVFQGSDWLSIKPRLQTAPSVVRPGPFDAKSYDTAYECRELK